MIETKKCKTKVFKRIRMMTKKYWERVVQMKRLRGQIIKIYFCKLLMLKDQFPSILINFKKHKNYRLCLTRYIQTQYKQLKIQQLKKMICKNI